jgi:signal transduction histidine kinase
MNVTPQNPQNSDAGERAQKEDRLRQSEKMEAIGRLVGGVAHDFNNLLTGVLLYCDLLLPELEGNGRLCRYVDEVRKAVEQGAALTRQLLAITRKETPKPHALDVNEVVLSMDDLLRRLIGEQVEMILELDAEAGTVFADAGQLRQVLLNLALNARDAVAQVQSGGGRIRISTARAERPKRAAPGDAAGAGKSSVGEAMPASALESPLEASSRSQRAVVLSVEDNGCGMDPETRSRVFELFFTTKQAGEGTGIGLATVQRIVGELDGVVAVESAPGSGTRIAVFLPAAERGGEVMDIRTSANREPGNLEPGNYALAKRAGGDPSAYPINERFCNSSPSSSPLLEGPLTKGDLTC